MATLSETIAVHQSLLDSIVVSSLSEQDKLNFGRLRLWGELGNGVASTIMMNIINHEHGFEKMFLLHGVSSVIAFMFMLHCVPTDQSSTKEVHTTQLSKRKVGWKEGVRVILSDAGLFGIFGLVTVAGFSMAILENFCYINIRKQYAESDMMDVAGREISFYRICFSLGGTLTWWFAGSWSRRFGSDVVMFAAVCCLPICFFSYAGLGSGSGVDQLTKVGFLIAEAIRSGVFAALWSNATVQMNVSAL